MAPKRKAKGLFPPVAHMGSSGKFILFLQLVLKGYRPDGPGIRELACNGVWDREMGFHLFDVIDDAFYVFFTNQFGIDPREIPLSIFTGVTRYRFPNDDGRAKVWSQTRAAYGRAFPPHLDFCSVSPRAVNGLAAFLLGALQEQATFSSRLVLDGEYGPVISEGVARLQHRLNQAGSLKTDLKEDGNFGPATRQAVAREYGIDFDALPCAPFMAKSLVRVKADGPLLPWPRADAAHTDRRKFGVGEKASLSMP